MVAIALMTLVAASACGTPPRRPTPSPSPHPTSRPTPVPLVWSAHEGSLSLKVVVTPPHPMVREEVTAEFFVTYSGTKIPKPHINYGYSLEYATSIGNVQVVTACVPFPGAIPSTPPPMVSSLDVHGIAAHFYLNPGPYRVTLEAHGTCGEAIGHPKIEHDVIVGGARQLPPGGFALPDHRDTDEPRTSKRVTLRAELVADPSTHCVWAKELPNGQRHAAIWPRFVWATVRPLRIYYDFGAEIWREGQPRGVYLFHPAPVASVPAACRTPAEPWGILQVLNE
jgi:hypothetical protein